MTPGLHRPALNTISHKELCQPSKDLTPWKGTLGDIKVTVLTSGDSGLKLGPIRMNQENKNKENEQTGEMISEDLNVFGKSNRMSRTPPGGADTVDRGTTKVTGYDKLLWESKLANANRPRHNSVAEINVSTLMPAQPLTSQMSLAPEKEKTSTPASSSLAAEANTSSRQEYIAKMRKEEECALQEVRRILRTMKAAIKVHKNIAKDVSQSVGKLDEILDQAGMYRRNWLRKEKEADHACERSKGKTDSKSNVATTPVPPAKPTTKRPLPSPSDADTPNGKRICDENTEGWQTVTARQKRTRTRKNGSHEPAAKTPRNATRGERVVAKKRTARDRGPRSEAVLIKPAEGHTYAEILKNLRNNVKPGDADVKIRTVRKTMAGALLLEMDRGAKVSPDFCEKIRTTLQTTAEVTGLNPTTTVEIRDLDSQTTVEEVEEAVRKILPENILQLKVVVTKPNIREMVRAYVTLPCDAAATLLETKTITIGWIRAKMRTRPNAKRCFRCFGAGHMQKECKGPDRSGKGLCIRCGEPGHKLRECIKPPKCCVCVDAGLKSVDHIPATGKCASVRTRK